MQSSMIHAFPGMPDPMDQIAAYLEWNHGRTPCRQVKSGMMSKYLRDYTVCALRDTDGKSESITTCHSAAKSILPSQSKSNVK